MAEWVQPTPEQLKKQIRDLILRHPERHDQAQWVSNEFLDEDDFRAASVDRIRRLFRRRKSIPDSPLTADGLCGTKGCVAGWGGILGSPPGTVLRLNYLNVRLVYPGEREEDIRNAAQRLLGLSDAQADWLFDSVRSRQEVLDGLDALIENPDANLEQLCA